MENNSNDDVEFDFTEETYRPTHSFEEDDDNICKEKAQEVSIEEKIKRFFSKKDKDSKKFMLYDDGNIKYVDNDSDLNYQDVINKSTNKIKEKTRKYSRTDYFRFFLICYLIVLPFIYYKYYYNDTKNLEHLEESIISNNTETSKLESYENQGNLSKNTANIEKPKPLDGKADLADKELTKGKLYYDNLSNEIAKYNNENIGNIRLYFNNRYNRGALKTSLEKNLSNQKNLYVHIESNKAYYEKEHKNLDELLDILLTDIATTTELLEQIDSKFTKNNVDAIFNKYHNN